MADRATEQIWTAEEETIAAAAEEEGGGDWEDGEERVGRVTGWGWGRRRGGEGGVVVFLEIFCG